MTKEKNEKENKEPRNFARRFASDYHIWRTIFYYIVLVFIVFPVQAFYYNLKEVTLNELSTDINALTKTVVNIKN